MDNYLTNYKISNKNEKFSEHFVLDNTKKIVLSEVIYSLKEYSNLTKELQFINKKYKNVKDNAILGLTAYEGEDPYRPIHYFECYINKKDTDKIGTIKRSFIKTVENKFKYRALEHEYKVKSQSIEVNLVEFDKIA